MAKGMAKGMVKGMAKGMAELLVGQVTHRFGRLTPDATARIYGATPKQLEQCSYAVIGAKTLEDVLAVIG